MAGSACRSSVLASCLTSLLALCACSRSGLLVDTYASGGAPAEIPRGVQPSAGAGGRGGDDHSPVDASTELDARVDEPDDSVPPLESCDDELGRGIFVLTKGRTLLRFDPITEALDLVGNLSCTEASPFSMAVDRTGVAFALVRPGTFDLLEPPGELVRVETADARCEVVDAYEPGQEGLTYFGMAFLGDDRGDTLYVASGVSASLEPGLAMVDTTSFELTLLGRQDPPFNRVELTRGPGGRLFALYSFEGSESVFIGELDSTDGHLIAGELVPGIQIPLPGSYAFAYWQGAFYLFIADPSSTTISRVRQSDWVVETISTFAGVQVVGAGRAPCRE